MTTSSGSTTTVVEKVTLKTPDVFRPKLTCTIDRLGSDGELNLKFSVPIEVPKNGTENITSIVDLKMISENDAFKIESLVLKEINENNMILMFKLNTY